MRLIVRNRFVKIILFVALAAVLSVPSAVNSQDVATGSATATVLTALAVTSSANLVFGNVYQGVATSIANIAAAAGIYAITGQGSAGIAIYMALPEYVALADGSDRMTISFSSSDASVDSVGGADPTGMVAGDGWQDIDPHSFPSAAVIGSGGLTNIYLGGKITPTINQTAGAYTGDVVLTVAYNGN